MINKNKVLETNKKLRTWESTDGTKIDYKKLKLWESTDGIKKVYRITDDGSGYCNSIEEMSAYYSQGTEIDLVKEIMKRENKILFENLVSGEEHTYEEYIEQFENEDDFPIMPYVDFESYEKAKEIWDLLVNE